MVDLYGSIVITTKADIWVRLLLAVVYVFIQRGLSHAALLCLTRSLNYLHTALTASISVTRLGILFIFFGVS